VHRGGGGRRGKGREREREREGERKRVAHEGVIFLIPGEARAQRYVRMVAISRAKRRAKKKRKKAEHRAVAATEKVAVNLRMS